MSTHHHNHAPKNNFGKAFFIGIILNTIFIILEIIYGLYANSLALLADAGHNASDVLGLFLAWGAVILSKRLPSERYTYGLQSSSIIAALGNAIFLLVASGGIGLEAIQRFSNPQESSSIIVMIVASIGILINGFTAWLFMAGRKEDLNIQGAFFHMIADAIISLGVVISAGLVLKTGYLWLDPLVSLCIAFIIVLGTWSLLRDSINLALHATPKNISTAKVKTYLMELPHVKEVHDLHIWAMSTTNSALSVHLLMPEGHPGDGFIKEITHTLEHDFHINHTTIQIEIGNAETECHFAPDHVI